MSEQTFGARYLALPSIAERLAFEGAEQRRSPFAPIDARLDRLVLAALQGERVVNETAQEKGPQPELQLPPEDRAVLDEFFSPEHQQGRGAWYLPASKALDCGDLHLAHWWKTSRRYTLTLADEDYLRAVALQTPDAVVLWAALEPLFADLALPIRLRSGPLAGHTEPEKFQSHWTDTILPVYAALEAGADVLREFALGSGWGTHDADGVMRRRDALLDSWAQADLESAARLRTYRIGRLVERYYSKAKNGRALRKRVMNNKAAERILSAYFVGDWLAFLDYLGEEAHADEEVTTALPKPRLLVTSSERAASVAAKHGVSAEEVERMLAAYWNQSGTGTPVERRVSALKSLWHTFDERHSEQASGVPEPYVLLAENSRTRYSEELVHKLDSLWSTKLLPRFPERLVTEPSPIRAAFRAFGPATHFFQEVALQAWHNTEGGRAHDELADLEEGMRKLTDALAVTGHPADPSLFAELHAAESRLGPIEEVWEEFSRENPRTWGTSMGTTRTRRDGFEILRDIITVHRRAWAQAHLGAYLHDRWKSDLQAAGEAYNRHAADRGKPPTMRQFAAKAADAATNWFGGDLTGVYGALGIKSKLTAPVYEPLLARDQRAPFRTQVRQELDAVGVLPGASVGDQVQYTNAMFGLRRLSFDWLELYEALGRPPTLSQVGTARFKHSAGPLSKDLDEAWKKYEAALGRALMSAREASAQAAADATRPASDRREAAPPLADDPGARASPEVGVVRDRVPAAAAEPAYDGTTPSSEPMRRSSVLRRLLGR